MGVGVGAGMGGLVIGGVVVGGLELPHDSANVRDRTTETDRRRGV
jgi:hypothetical protein